MWCVQRSLRRIMASSTTCAFGSRSSRNRAMTPSLLGVQGGGDGRCGCSAAGVSSDHIIVLCPPCLSHCSAEVLPAISFHGLQSSTPKLPPLQPLKV